MRDAFVVCGCVLLATCSGGEPSLSISFQRGQISDDGEVTTVTVRAVDAAGLPGRGMVRIYSLAGLLKDGESWSLDANGVAETGISCSVAVDPACVNVVRVFAEWETGGKKVVADKRLLLAGPTGAGGGSGGGGGGAGGGSSVLPPHPVWLLGTLVEGLAHREAFAPLTAPLDSRVGFPDGLSNGTAIVTRTGDLVYRDLGTGTRAFRRWRVDLGRSTDAGWLYPATPEANDEAIATPSGCSEMIRVFAWPDTGALVTECTGGAYFDPAGQPLDTGGRTLQLLGHGGVMLTSRLSETVVRSADGTEATVTGLQSGKLMRAAPNGFWYVADNNCSLHLIGLDGSVSHVGDYAPLPANATPINGDGCVGAAGRWTTLDSTGNLYVWVTGTGAGLPDAIAVRRLMPATSSVVYDEGMLPATDFAARPPVLPVKMHDFALLAP